VILRPDLRRVTVEAVAVRHGLDPCLVAAFCQQESSWDAHAFNPEPQYRYLWDILKAKPFREITAAEGASESPPADFPAVRGVPTDAEWQLQQASIGIMQVMGAVARELGFSGRFLLELCEPEIGLEYGCRKLAALSRRCTSADEIAAAYNTGAARKNAAGIYVTAGGQSAQAYVDGIRGHYETYRREWK